MKVIHLERGHVRGMAFALGLLLLCPFASAQNIVANFTGGNGTDAVDQYTGIDGNGWFTGWQVNTNDASTGTTLTGTVVDTTPLNGGGNYLSSTLTAGSGTGKGVQQRWFDTSAGVSLAAPFTVTFDLRMDSDLTTFTSTTDYIQAFDRPLFQSDFGDTGTWLIRAAGASVNGIQAHNWMFYNGTKNGGGFNAANFVDSGVSLVTGEVYHFVINVDPTLLEYAVSINGGAFSQSLGFRTGDAANLGMLNFGGQLSGAGEVMTYSLDSIAAVPEPSAMALCAVAGVAGMIFLRRQKNRA